MISDYSQLVAAVSFFLKSIFVAIANLLLRSCLLCVILLAFKTLLSGVEPCEQLERKARFTTQRLAVAYVTSERDDRSEEWSFILFQSQTFTTFVLKSIHNITEVMTYRAELNSLCNKHDKWSIPFETLTPFADDTTLRVNKRSESVQWNSLLTISKLSYRKQWNWPSTNVNIPMCKVQKLPVFQIYFP